MAGALAADTVPGPDVSGEAAAGIGSQPVPDAGLTQEPAAGTGISVSPEPAPELPAPDWSTIDITKHPEYQSRKDKEIAAAQAKWQRAESDRISQQAMQAERDRAARERTDLVTRARGGDMEAQARLAEDEYARLAEQNTRNQAFLQLAREADQAVAQLAEGDATLMAQLDIRRYRSIPEWTQALADARVEKRAAAMAAERAEALATSRLAELRNKLPNPDTHEMVGGSGGGPLSYKSQADLEAKYVAAKQAGDADAVQRIRGLMRSRDFARLPKSA